jgi:hypothetical protein
MLLGVLITRVMLGFFNTAQMSRTPSTATPTWHQFERKVDEVKPSKT